MSLKKYSKKIVLGLLYSFLVFLYLITFYGQIRCSYVGYSNPELLPRLKGECINTCWNFLFYFLSASFFFPIVCKLIMGFVSYSQWSFKQIFTYYLIYLIYGLIFVLYFFYFSYTDFYVNNIVN